MNAVVEHVPLPSRQSVRQLLEDLAGRDIEIADGRPVPARTTNVTGLYVTAKLATAAIAVVDLEGAARLGGAIAGIGRAVVEECIGRRQLTPALLSAAERGLNALPGTFAGPVPIRLYQMYAPNDVVPSDAAALAGTARNRMDVSARIAGYGSAQISIVVA
jgi:hypothetical protein